MIPKENLLDSFSYHAQADEKRDIPYLIRLHWICRIIESSFDAIKTPKLKIGDFGCGPGTYLRDIVLKINSFSTHTQGIDFSEEMIAKATALSKDKTSSMKWDVGDLQQPESIEKICNGEKLHVVLLIGVVSYLSDIVSILETIADNLESNGIIIIINHSPYSITNLVLRIQSLFDEQLFVGDNPSKTKVINAVNKTCSMELKSSNRLPCGGIHPSFYKFGQLFWDGYGLVISKKRIAK